MIHIVKFYINVFIESQRDGSETLREIYSLSGLGVTVFFGN